MLLQPDHRAVHALVAARMIVEENLLERTRPELAVRREPHRRHRKAVRLGRGVEPERVGFGLGLARDRVRERVASRKNSEKIAIASGNAAGSVRPSSLSRAPHRASAAFIARCTIQSANAMTSVRYTVSRNP